MALVLANLHQLAGGRAVKVALPAAQLTGPEGAAELRAHPGGPH